VPGRYEPLNSDAFNADKTVNALGAESTTDQQSHLTDRSSPGAVSYQGDQALGAVDLWRRPAVDMMARSRRAMTTEACLVRIWDSAAGRADEHARSVIRPWLPRRGG
jgi:hypothetical protein